MGTFGQLGQVADGTGDTAVTLYTVASNVSASNLFITVCNVTATADDFRIFQDDNGTIATIVTAIYYDYPVAANQTLRIPVGPMSTATGTIRVSSSVADAVTFTLHGIEDRV